jgi:RNA polymerase sigma-70 factor (sigma-E family)
VERERAEFAKFYDENRDDCLRAVMATVGDPQLAEDLVADAFAKAWASWRKVARHPSPRAWLIRTMLNTRVSWWRRRHREVALGDHDQIAPAQLQTGLDQTLLGVLQRLPRRQREVVALRIVLDLDTQATAEALGIAEGSVKAHLSRAISTLRKHIVPADR